MDNALRAINRPESLLNFKSGSRLPVIVQTEVAECGLACLAMIAGFYGYTTDLASLRRKFSISSRGTNLKQLMDIAGDAHLSTRALRLECEDLVQLQLPCILHWDLNHFVVLKAVKRKKIVVHDPMIGERQLSLDEFSRHFTGVAVELMPTPEFEKGEDKQLLKISHFWSRVVGLKRSLILILILSMLLQVFGIVSPFYMQIIIDDVILRNDYNLMIVLAIGFGLLMLIQVATTALRQFVILYASNLLSMQMSANLFRHLIRLPMEYFSKRHMGDIVSRFGSLGNVRQLLTTGLITAIVDGLMGLATLIAMFFYSVSLTLVVISIVALYAVLRWAFFRPFRMLTEESIIAGASENSHFMESVRAMQTIKLFQRENDRQSQWQNRLAEVINKNIRLANWGVFYEILNGLLFGIENILIIYLAADAVMGNVMSIGMLYAFLSYKARFIGAMDGLISQFIELKMLDLHLGRLADIAYTKPESSFSFEGGFSLPASHRDTQDETPSSSKLTGRIEVRNLSYSYSEVDPPVFEDLNFSIEPGETVAIIGPSGCGKTTLLKCLMGLIMPSGGDIVIDGTSLHRLPHYRQQIAGVMQDDALLSGSIADNIACFDHNLDLNRVNFCANLANVHQDVMRMPMQYHTLVGDMGTTLSGGQKQRIILARALYRAPRILFLDEATSHLDSVSESVVNRNIKSLPITRVVVAHRQETIASADRVISLFSER